MTGNHKAGIVLQPRDHRLLEAVGQMRLIDREMSKVILKLAATRNTNKRLLELTRAGLLQQYFVGTVGGGRKAVKGMAEIVETHRADSGSPQRAFPRALDDADRFFAPKSSCAKGVRVTRTTA